MTLADEVATIVHAFSDRGRKDAIRDLARRVRAVEERLKMLESERELCCCEAKFQNKEIDHG